MLWPFSNFAMLRPADTQCPQDSSEGSLTHISDGGWISDNYNAMGDYETLHFCTFDHVNRTAAAKHWPAGEYCISRVGGECPQKGINQVIRYQIKNISIRAVCTL